MIDAEAMIERLSDPLSLRRRLLTAVALVSGLAGALLVGALWLTEPARLPARTSVAFALLITICLTWALYGTWVLTRRTPLFALERVVAGRIALLASVTSTAISAATVAARGSRLELAAVLAVGVVMIGAAAVITARAQRERARLLRRKRELLARRS